MRVGSQVARTGIREVARRAGVSVGTVSNVLNRPDLVAASTRDRVRSAITDLGFVRNETARMLRQGPSARIGAPRALGMVVENVTNPYFTDVGRGAEAAMNAAGVDAIWCTSDSSAAKEQRCLDFLAEQRAAGVLLMPVDDDPAPLARLREQGMAAVLVDRDIPGFCSVRVDHVLGGALAVSYLLGRGHQRIALVTGGPEPEPCRDRRLGAEQAMRRAASGELLIVSRPDLTIAEGGKAAQRLLRRTELPSAVFCANDLLAIGLVNELLRAGVKVPPQIAATRYDDIHLPATPP